MNIAELKDMIQLLEPKKEFEFKELEKRYRNFYAPSFAVFVNHEDMLKQEVEIISVSVEASLEEADRFSFTVNNAFDPVKRDFRYIDSFFEPGNLVEIKMGYVDQLKTVFFGTVTSVRVSFPSSGLPELEVGGLSMSNCMMRGKITKTWPNARHSDIVRGIASKYKLDISNIKDTSVVNKIVEQDQESDYVFIDRLAKENNFEFFVMGTSMIFRPPSRNVLAPVTLEWGVNLISFSPEINIAEQVTKVKVRGWNVAQKKEVTGEAGSIEETEKEENAKSGLDYIRKTCVESKEVIEDIHRPVSSEHEANMLAKAILEKHAQELVEGSGESVGIPEIRPGAYIRLLGLGKKFSKIYYIKSATHTVSSSGYRTTFHVRRKFI